MTVETFAAIGQQIAANRSAIGRKLDAPKSVTATVSNWALSPRATADVDRWVGSGVSRTYETGSPFNWGHRTTTCARGAFSVAGDASIYVRFKPSDGLATGKTQGDLIPMGVEFCLSGGTAGTTEVEVVAFWFGATGQTTATLFTRQAVTNDLVYWARGNYTWPSPSAVTAGGTNDFWIQIKVYGAPIGCSIRGTNAHVGHADFFDGDTPDSDLERYDWTGTVHGSRSTRNTLGVGDGTQFLASDGTFKTPSGSAVTSVAGRTGAVTLAAADITDSTVTGRSVVTAADAADARAAIGAGTSSLAIGATGTTAKAGNWAPAFADLPGGLVGFSLSHTARGTARTDVAVIFITTSDPTAVMLTNDVWLRP